MGSEETHHQPLNVSDHLSNHLDPLNIPESFNLNENLNITNDSSVSCLNDELNQLIEKNLKELKNELWANIPDIFLEKIFLLLSFRDRHSVSQVCWNWYRVFNSSYLWSTIIVHDKTLTRRKYNYYLGYQHQLDHYRVQLWLGKFGKHLRKIIITPMANFFNLYELVKMLTQFSQYFEQNPLSKVDTFDFTFNCRFEKDNDKELVFGTGGTLFKGLKQLLSNLPGIIKKF